MNTTDKAKKIVNKFNNELQAFAQETGEEVATLYEDAFTFFTLTNVRLVGSSLRYVYDGKEESEKMFDDDDVKEWVSFWRACLRRAKRYWAMDCDQLDRIQSGEIEDKDND